MKKDLLIRILRNRWLQHLIFWGVAYYLLLRLFASSSKLMPIDFTYTIVFLITLLLCVNVNLFVLIPLFLARQRYLLYGLLLTLSVFLFH